MKTKSNKLHSWGIGTTYHGNGQLSYGYPETNDPIKFYPDHTVSTQDEIDEWKKQCFERGPHHPDPSLRSGVEGEANTADQSNDLSVIDRRRLALDAAKIMLAHHYREAKHWQQEVADLESEGGDANKGTENF